jgi:hypothetical protein
MFKMVGLIGRNGSETKGKRAAGTWAGPEAKECAGFSRIKRDKSLK